MSGLLFDEGNIWGFVWPLVALPFFFTPALALVCTMLDWNLLPALTLRAICWSKTHVVITCSASSAIAFNFRNCRPRETCVYTHSKKRGSSNEKLILSSFFKRTIKFVFNRSRRQKADGCLYLRVLVTACWFGWLHLCNLKKRITIGTVATVQEFSFEPVLPKPTGKLIFLRCDGAHNTGTAVLSVDICRTRTSWHNLYVCHTTATMLHVCVHTHICLRVFPLETVQVHYMDSSDTLRHMLLNTHEF